MVGSIPAVGVGKIHLSAWEEHGVIDVLLSYWNKNMTSYTTPKVYNVHFFVCYVTRAHN
jgi:hypothetical protein